MKQSMTMWGSINDLEKKILIDADVIRHFIRGQQTCKLSQIFPENLYILDMVEAELDKSKKIKPHLESLIDDGTLKKMNFPTGKRFMDEYLTLTRSNLGPGEAACLAVAKHTDDIVASSNLRDIFTYCSENSILYLTTLDFLYVAYKKGIMDESEIDYFLYLNCTGDNPSRIPYMTLQLFIDSNPQIHIFFENSQAG